MRNQLRDIPMRKPIMLSEVRPRRRLPDPEWRRGLDMLAAVGPRGYTETMLLAHGFKARTLNGLVRAGLAIREAEMVSAGARTMEVLRVRIADAGLQELEGLTRLE